jgi:hypothetical protein
LSFIVIWPLKVAVIKPLTWLSLSYAVIHSYLYEVILSLLPNDGREPK